MKRHDIMLTRVLTLSCAAAVVVFGLHAAAQAPADAALVARAKTLLATSPLIDGHNDLPVGAARERCGSRLRQDRHHASAQPKLMTDIPRLKAGGVGGQFWSVYVPATLQGDDAVTRHARADRRRAPR